MIKLINSDQAPAAVGPFSHAIEANGMIYASGQLPIDFESGQIPEGLEAQTRASMKNLTEVLKAGGCSLKDVVKTTVYLSDIGNFAAFNAIYAEYFSAPFPARSCYAVKDLPKGAMVEIEAIAAKP